MNEDYQEKLYPESAGKEIAFILYNFNNMEDVILDKKENIIYASHGGVNSWLRRKDNPVEEAVIKFDTSPQIKRLLVWQKLITDFLIKYKNTDYYKLIKYKYFLDEDEADICEKFKINYRNLQNLKVKVKNIIYLRAIKYGLYKEIELDLEGRKNVEMWSDCN